MGSSKAPRIVVAGAGVLGLAIAWTLAGRGYAVTVRDPAPGGPNASSIAAGLLAPIGEAVFDPAAAGHFLLLSHAFGLWRDFAEQSQIRLLMGETIVPSIMATCLSELGAKVSSRDGSAIYRGDAHVAYPLEALNQLRARAVTAGARFEAACLTQVEPGALTIIASGPGASQLTGLAPELICLTPIKGQIAVLPNGPVEGPVHRWSGGYLVPQTGGARAGATMEEGRFDTASEAEVVARLASAAAERVPGLDVSASYGLAGVRMATPDGLPLVGPSRTSNVLLAAGARRNGWLLAPLVAEVIAAYVAGKDPGPWARALHPSRFDQQ